MKKRIKKIVKDRIVYYKERGNKYLLIEPEDEQLYTTRIKYIENQYDQCKQFDKSVFLVSSGLFGLSFTFISTLVKSPEKLTNKYLLLSWLFMILCILFSLIAYVINYYAYKKAIEIIDEIIKDKKYYCKKNNFTCIAEIFNIVNLILLAAGLFYMLYYVACNI